MNGGSCISTRRRLWGVEVLFLVCLHPYAHPFSILDIPHCLCILSFFCSCWAFSYKIFFFPVFFLFTIISLAFFFPCVVFISLGLISFRVSFVLQGFLFCVLFFFLVSFRWVAALHDCMRDRVSLALDIKPRHIQPLLDSCSSHQAMHALGSGELRSWLSTVASFL
ncbi:hypothetical protein IWX47DRAFT_479476 [Phyllosticta citricarpa]